ncbi:MAG: hypothetical protein KKA42_14100 [candidate division Zixibacteria bacterium]|nr:hypothetical protein [candidate division Zixibacteria bacterium]
MTIRDQHLDTVAPVLATFYIHQTDSVDDLKDDDIGSAVTLTDSNEIGLISNGDLLLGKLISLTLTDADNGDRLATVQLGGICRLPVSATVPEVGDRVVGGADGAVRQAPALTGYDPAGGSIGRGTVLAANGTTDCVILLN